LKTHLHRISGESGWQRGSDNVNLDDHHAVALWCERSTYSTSRQRLSPCQVVRRRKLDLTQQVINLRSLGSPPVHMVRHNLSCTIAIFVKRHAEHNLEIASSYFCGQVHQTVITSMLSMMVCGYPSPGSIKARSAETVREDCPLQPSA